MYSKSRYYQYTQKGKTRCLKNTCMRIILEGGVKSEDNKDYLNNDTENDGDKKNTKTETKVTVNKLTVMNRKLK